MTKTQKNIRDHALAFLREEGGLTAEDIYWMMPADVRPSDKRSVMKRLRKMRDEGLIKASRRWGKKTVWRLTHKAIGQGGAS